MRNWVELDVLDTYKGLALVSVGDGAFIVDDTAIEYYDPEFTVDEFEMWCLDAKPSRKELNSVPDEWKYANDF